MWQQHLYPEATDVLKQLQKESDRSAALIGGSVVEYHATQAIRARLHKVEKAQEWLFNPKAAGPFSNFGVKAELCYLLGITTREACAELKKIVSIRNLFAHRLDVVKFQSPDAKSLVQELGWFERHAYDASRQMPDFESAVATNQLLTSPQVGFFRLREKLKTPRQRYLVCCQVFSTLFAYAPRVKLYRHDG
jgi:hypothetical protein